MTSATLENQSTELEMDLPARLDACLQSTFLLGLSLATQQSAVYYLSKIREQVIGTPRLKTCIDEGYSAEMLGTILDDIGAVKQSMRNMEGIIRDLALGYTVIQLATQYDVASIGNDPSLDSVRLTRLQRLADTIEAKTSPALHFDDIDRKALYTYIEDQKVNGNLVGDPAWELEKSRRKKLGWQDSLLINLKKLDLTFQGIAAKIDWIGVSQRDCAIIENVDVANLISLLFKTYEMSSARLPSGPLPKGCDSSEIDADAFVKVAKQFRTELLHLHKQKANETFKMGQNEQAEAMYKDSIEAGSNDPSIPLNRAAALLRLDRYEESITCCTLGLMQLEVSGAHKSTKISKGSMRPSERSEKMQLSAEEVKTLQWKCYVRRGRAQKALFERVKQTDVKKAGKATQDRLLELARDDFEAAIQIDPHDSLPKQELALLQSLMMEEGDTKDIQSEVADRLASIRVSS